MEGTRFDALTRRAAIKGSVAAIAALAVGVGLTDHAGAARGGVEKVAVCHFDQGVGEFELITIGEPAVAHHLANHEGDHLVSDTCTGACGGFCDADAGEECVDGACVVLETV